MTFPTIVAHADWGLRPRKRQMAVAELEGDSGGHPPAYTVTSLEPVADVKFLAALHRAAAPYQAMIGFDYPIGLPRAYARAAQISSFRGFLTDRLGLPPWVGFGDVARTAEEVSLHRPFYPDVPGGAKRDDLYKGLRLSARQLRRECERDDAEILFWTLGGKQVGKGALAGSQLLREELRTHELGIAIWPFDGPLESLLDGASRLIVAETYPREYYRSVKPKGTTTSGWSKRRRKDRLTWIPTLLSRATQLGVSWNETLLRRVEHGLSEGPNGEDEFDAIVGLLGMLAVITGATPSGEPEDDDVTSVEGWILGRPRYRDIEMPDWFALESQLPTGDWIDQAFCTPEHFARQRDGSYLRSDGGSGLWIRAHAIAPDGVIDHVDGGGNHYRYRLHPLPSNRYPDLEKPREETPY